MIPHRLYVFTFFLTIFLQTVPQQVGAQHWSNWGATPVFHDGRAMPLNSFAEQIVREICGTSTPYIVYDDSILTRLQRIADERALSLLPQSLAMTREEALKNPLLSGEGRGLAEATVETDDVSPVEHSALVVKSDAQRANAIVRQIKNLIPPNGKRFTSQEILLSWMGEPEIWDYIPILQLENSETRQYVPIGSLAMDYRTKILDLPSENQSHIRMQRVAVVQLLHSSSFQRQLAEVDRKQRESGASFHPTSFDGITVQLANSLNLFQQITFNPLRHRPTKMLDTIQHVTEYQGSFHTTVSAWHYLERLGGDVDNMVLRPTINPTTGEKDFANPERIHPVMARYELIETLLADLAEAYARYPQGDDLAPAPMQVEHHFEYLLNLIDLSLEESELLMEYVYPGVPFRQQRFAYEFGTQAKLTDFAPLLFSDLDSISSGSASDDLKHLVIRYHYSLKQFRKEIESAYLALYDNGRSVRMLPLAARQSFDESLRNDAPPWASFQTSLYAGDNMIRRFFEPNFIGQKNDAGNPVTPFEPVAARQGKFRPPKLFSSLFRSYEESDEELPPTDDLDDAISPLTTEGAVSETASTEMGLTEVFSITLQNDETKNLLESSEQEKSDSALFSAAQRQTFGSETTDINPSDRLTYVRQSFRQLVSAYNNIHLAQGEKTFSNTAGELRKALRHAAGDTDQYIASIATSKTASMQNYLHKTKYPTSHNTWLEYYYFQAAPFFWMWCFAAISLLFFLLAYYRGQVQRAMIDMAMAQKELEAENKGDAGHDSKIMQSSIASSIVFLSTSGMSASASSEVAKPKPRKRKRCASINTSEEVFFWIGLAFLFLSIFVTVCGGVTRAMITGWIPVTNMYETIILFAFCAALLGIWFLFIPLTYPALPMAWSRTAFPGMQRVLGLFGFTKQELAFNTATPLSFNPQKQINISVSELNATSDPVNRLPQTLSETTWQWIYFVPRLLLCLLTFFLLLRLCYGESIQAKGYGGTIAYLLTGHELIDGIVVILSLGLIVWFVPRFLLTGAAWLMLLRTPFVIANEMGIVDQSFDRYNSSSQGRGEFNKIFQGENAAGLQQQSKLGTLWFQLVRQLILERQFFAVAAALVVLLAGLAATCNGTEFSSNIRLPVAVLRSNFWLAIHVISIIAGYAAAAVAWGMSLFVLGFAIFGTYRITVDENEKKTVQLPILAELYEPSIVKLLQIALVLITLGTILGARWADYSWGRFWGWDPKEVWALISICCFAIVLHGRVANMYGKLGLTVGAVLSFVIVILTWYAPNYLLKAGMHAYGGGTPDYTAMAILTLFIVGNIIWAMSAIFRYTVVKSATG